METLWIDEANFVRYIQEAGDSARLENIEGVNRWVVTRDGIEYIIRPKYDDHADVEKVS